MNRWNQRLPAPLNFPAYLNEPWSVTPASDSDCIISLATSNVTVFQNTIAGDGALSFLPNAAGVAVGGLDIAIDDNDISGLPTGIIFEAYEPLELGIESGARAGEERRIARAE